VKGSKQPYGNVTLVASRNPQGLGTGPGGNPTSGLGRSRIVSLLAVAGLIALVGGILRYSCVGHSCDEADGAENSVPFCSLPREVRTEIAAGFRDGRSPDILGVTNEQIVTGGTAFEKGSLQPTWPSTSMESLSRIPIVFSGAGVAAGTTIPAGTSLDDIAATLAHISGERRPHPEVRSGTAIDGVAAGEAPRLILEVVWKGIGSADLSDPADGWPFLQGLMSEGAGTSTATTGSLPLDPAASLTTIGTGGLPNQHGITGTLVKNEEGDVVQAWSPRAPISVIATFPDDLDEAHAERPMIGLVGTSVADRGVIGGNWYTTGDRDEIVIEEGATVQKLTRVAQTTLKRGYGSDEILDVLAVVMEGDVDRLDQALGRLVETADEVSGDAVTVVVAGTGSATTHGAEPIPAADVAAEIEDTVPADGEVIEATTPGGIYLNQKRLADEKISEDVVLSAMRTLRIGAAPRPFADAFAAIAVSFERYC
jgi:hypothetical protein